MGLEYTDPERLPRQRRGTTPQLHGRYPDYDVLANADHWDQVTRRTVLDRVENVPPIRLFSAAQAATAAALCDLLTAQDREPRIPVLNYIDEKLHTGSRDGYQYFDMPDDGEAWQMILQGLDEQAAGRAGSASFAAAPEDVRFQIVSDFAEPKLHGVIATLRRW